jgi:UDP-N-acetylmuramate dehydrogenase
VLDNAELEFGYRDSLLKRAGARYVVVSVTLELQRHGPLHSSYDALRQLLPAEAGPYSARQIADAVVQVRRSKLPDPAVLGNAGSFFKNPLVSADCFAQLQQRWGALPAYPQADGRVKLAAGWLIERAGLKGWRRGDAATHERQALVIVNHGKASGREIVALAREVRDKVQAQFEVELVPEVRILDRRADEVPL